MNKQHPIKQNLYRDLIALQMALLADEVENAQQIMASLRDPSQNSLARISTLFGLNEFEQAVLWSGLTLCLAPQLHQAFEARSGYRFLHEALIRDLYGQPLDARLSRQSPLIAWRIVALENHQFDRPPAIIVNPVVLDWLQGTSGLPPELSARIGDANIGKERAAWARSVPDQLAAQMAAGARLDHAHIIDLPSAHHGEAERFAAWIAQQFAMRAYRISGSEFSSEEMLLLHRFAKLQNAALIWEAGNAQIGHVVGGALPRLQFVIGGKGGHGHDDHRAKRFTITLDAARRKTQSPFVQEIAADMGWDDIVLAPELAAHLRRFAFEIEARNALWSNPKIARVYAQERALIGLFLGPPGVGKTLAAKVVANATKRPLLRVDAAQLASKYVSETAKNMSRLIADIGDDRPILFFDEGEAIMSKRVDVRDAQSRHSNFDIAHLLQLLETDFDGVAIFATNRAQDMDPAMHRRVRMRFEFQNPNESERRALWALALAPFDAAPALIAFSEQLAAMFAFTGARIKAVVLTAYYLAKADGLDLNAESLAQAAIEECEKDGRAIGKAERSALAAAIRSEEDPSCQ